MTESSLIKEEGTPWTKITCVKCDDDSGYELYLHDDYHKECVHAVCMGCGKIYFLESHV